MFPICRLQLLHFLLHLQYIYILLYSLPVSICASITFLSGNVYNMTLKFSKQCKITLLMYSIQTCKCIVSEAACVQQKYRSQVCPTYLPLCHWSCSYLFSCYPSPQFNLLLPFQLLPFPAIQPLMPALTCR